MINRNRFFRLQVQRYVYIRMENIHSLVFLMMVVKIGKKIFKSKSYRYHNDLCGIIIEVIPYTRNRLMIVIIEWAEN